MFTVALREMLMRKDVCNMRATIQLLLENEFGHVMSRFVRFFSTMSLRDLLINICPVACGIYLNTSL